ncbi:MAG: hypothetical protein AB7O32_14475 [Vicinamibacterales bacterium]
MSHRTSTRLYVVLAALVLGAVPAAAQYRPRPMAEMPLSERYRIEGSFGLWNPTPEMTVTSESFGVLGTPIDLVNDLGLAKKRLPPMGLTFHPARKHKLRFEYIPLKYSAEAARLPRDVIFNGQRFRAGTTVDSQLDWKAYRFTYEYDFISMSRGFGGFLLDLKATDINLGLQTPTPRLDEFTRLRAPVPAVGGIVRIYLIPELSVTGEVSGITVPKRDLYDFNGHYADLNIYGTFNVTRNVGAQFGYRSFDVEAEISNDAGTFTMKGLYFGVVARY